ncbi:Alpha/Beta hydrolase protein [Aspergillus pseudotamarii]|uniref:Alpha/Beta hydrolase protein n=1 Tax=Aspergillus pseudotamarii TaxID=132259 RepID=A0A5N6TCR5_ASPPS|nr:Alpha/Beta hydrolase protein [Aspergillus pseudotamarii]KAE8143959.1 Alpha/Beta hydrolase protein [Aspergillus pseudotamarii]
MASSIASHQRLVEFDLVQSHYKKVGDHEIRADFIIPHAECTGKRPLIVRFHGGGLITGDSLSMDWFPQWLLDLAKKHHAVIATANYRLLPEATSLDIFEDVEDFWTWLHSSEVERTLSSCVNPTKLDLDRVITAGESAGGLLSVCLALAHPDEIRAATASYPCLDMASAHFSTPNPVPLTNPPVPESLIDETLALGEPGAIRSSVLLPDRFDLMLAAIHYGRITQLYERKIGSSHRRDLRYPLEKIEQPDVKIPRGGIAIIQGLQDDIVPAEGNQKFAEKAREVMKGKPGADKVILTLRDGAHGFDIMTRLEEEWIQEHLKAAVEAWLA